MRVLLEQIINVSIWGVLPVFLAFIIFFVCYYDKMYKKRSFTPIR